LVTSLTCSENSYQRLENEHLELNVFTQDEKDVINCRTPGQVVEVSIIYCMAALQHIHVATTPSVSYCMLPSKRCV